MIVLEKLKLAGGCLAGVVLFYAMVWFFLGVLPALMGVPG